MCFPHTDCCIFISQLIFSSPRFFPINSATQKYLLGECGLLGSIMGKISEYSTAPSPSVPKVASSGANLDAQGQDVTDNVTDENSKTAEGASSSGSSSSSGGGSGGSAFVPLTMMPKHSSVMGHLVLIAQVLFTYMRLRFVFSVCVMHACII